MLPQIILNNSQLDYLNLNKSLLVGPSHRLLEIKVDDTEYKQRIDLKEVNGEYHYFIDDKDIDDIIMNNERFEIINTEEAIDNLCKMNEDLNEEDKILMKRDLLKLLITLDDYIIFDKEEGIYYTSTDKEYNEICDEILGK